MPCLTLRLDLAKIHIAVDLLSPALGCPQVQILRLNDISLLIFFEVYKLCEDDAIYLFLGLIIRLRG